MKLQLNKTALAVAQAMACIALASCGGANEDFSSLPENEQAIGPAPAPAPAPSSSTTVSWAMPSSNVDGTQLTDIAGYRIVYGTSATALTQSVDVAGASTTSKVIGGLSKATYYFAVLTINAAGTASNQSGVAAVAIQ